MYWRTDRADDDVDDDGKGVIAALAAGLRSSVHHIVEV